MNSLKPGKIRTPIGQRIKRARYGVLPILVWLGACGLVAKFWSEIPHVGSLSGIVQADQVHVAAPLAGSIEFVFADVFSTVEIGDPLVSLDDSSLQAEIRTAQAELKRLGAELAAARVQIEREFESERSRLEADFGKLSSTYSLEFPSETRAFFSDETELELSVIENDLAVTMSDLELGQLEHKVLRAQAMVSSEIGSEVDLEILEDLRDLERARGVTYRRLGVGIKVALKAAINRRLAVTSSFALLPAPNPTPPRTDERLAGLAEALVVQQKRIEELTIQREAYDLRASMPGQITALHIAPGGFLSAGSPILTITNPEPSSIAVWVSEDYRDVPSQGSLLRVSNGVATADCIVLAVSSRVEMIPSRLWKASDIEEYGRVFSVSPAPSLELRPGERVRLEVADQSDLD